ncbi:uncharacterized protein LOC135697141 [Ochlerotatus camptorhynchus]|uniref:uncharacterized protein LOC135697141 n=1 Tax=Ochlerotatus camptorhynchus TaxID=644619 RepID=UPI0031D1959B
MSGKKAKTNKDTAAALLEAIQQEGRDSLEKLEIQNSSTQTEPDESAGGIDSINTNLNKCLLLLSHVNTKVDALAAMQCQQGKTTSSVKLAKINLQPVKSLADLESLEDSCRDEGFVKTTVASIGGIHGHHRYTGNGATVSLQIIDYFFSRHFLLKCSWTGTSRTSGKGETKKQKIPFMKFDKTINLFYQTVVYSDPNYTLSDCKIFLHRCLKNAKQRFTEVTGTRKSVSRKRRRLENAEGRTEDHRWEERKENGSSTDEIVDEGPLEETAESASWQNEVLENYEEFASEMFNP